MVRGIASRLADQEGRLTFVKTEGGQARPSRDRAGGGYGPYFGSVPDFSESPVPGMRLAGIRPGSPAGKAGLRAGDIIVKFAGMAVKNLDDLVFALRSRRAGDVVEVIYLRDGLEHAAQATLEERR
jgi:S1-C subfamily serine protease